MQTMQEEEKKKEQEKTDSSFSSWKFVGSCCLMRYHSLCLLMVVLVVW